MKRTPHDEVVPQDFPVSIKRARRRRNPFGLVPEHFQKSEIATDLTAPGLQKATTSQ